MSFIGTRIYYGCILYGSAYKSNLKRISSIQSKALRICLGAMNSNPVAALQVNVGETPLVLRREYL